MKFNWFGVLLIVVGVSILAGMTYGQNWFNVLIRFWPVLFIIRALNGWEREDQTKAFQVAQIGLGSFLIADNFISMPALDGIWQYWPALLVLAGLYYIFGESGGHRQKHILIGVGESVSAKSTSGAASKFHIVKPLEEGARKADVRIDFNAGRLILGGETGQLMEADISTSFGEPEIKYVHGEIAKLDIRQGDRCGVAQWGEHDNTWYLKFSDSLPLAFDIEANAGKAELDLTSYIVEKVGLEGNAGKFTVRIGEKSPEVRLNADVNAGKVTIFVPGKAGVTASGSSALGSVDIDGAGLVKEGSQWISPGFDAARVKIFLVYSVNVGKITLKRF